jgi:hypothetical protein
LNHVINFPTTKSSSQDPEVTEPLDSAESLLGLQVAGRGPAVRIHTDRRHDVMVDHDRPSRLPGWPLERGRTLGHRRGLGSHGLDVVPTGALHFVKTDICLDAMEQMSFTGHISSDNNTVIVRRNQERFTT